jgi:hypothetical protein
LNQFEARGKPEAAEHGFPVEETTLDANSHLDKINESGEGKFSVRAKL